MSCRISLIAALSESLVIGRNGRIPWELPEDLKRFRAITSGHPVIMGRKTFESIGRPLPNRRNIVISRDPAYAPVGAEAAPSLDEALARAAVGKAAESFVIGGGEIYRLALPRADRLYLTLVRGHYEGDAFFPDWRGLKWIEAEREEHPAFTYLTLDRAPKA